MKKTDVNIDARTIRQLSVESRGSYGPPLTKPLLTEDHRKDRLRWGQKHRRFKWSNVIFSVEKTFELHGRGRNVWRLPDTERVARKFKHAAQLKVWCCFSEKGFGHLICFKKNLAGCYMCDS